MALKKANEQISQLNQTIQANVLIQSDQQSEINWLKDQSNSLSTKVQEKDQLMQEQL